MTFEDWLDEYLMNTEYLPGTAPESEWTVEDVQEAWNAGWDACNEYLASGGTFR